MQNQAWEPPPPLPDEFDWIQLTSGEWLKGEIKRLYERKLEFDSVKLDLQEFDWKDVKQVRGASNFQRPSGRADYGSWYITDKRKQGYCYKWC